LVTAASRREYHRPARIFSNSLGFFTFPRTAFADNVAGPNYRIWYSQFGNPTIPNSGKQLADTDKTTEYWDLQQF